MGTAAACDEEGRIRRQWATRRWIACRPSSAAGCEPLMQPGKFTELFFLDEATAFAAGHRPCALPPRGLRALRRALERDPSGAVGADAIDAQLHAAWTAAPSGFTKRRSATCRTARSCSSNRPWLVLGGGLRRWTPAGYERSRPLPARGLVITSPSLVEVLRAGWKGAVPLLRLAGRVTASLPRKTIPSWLSVRSPLSLRTKLQVTCPVAPQAAGAVDHVEHCASVAEMLVRRAVLPARRRRSPRTGDARGRSRSLRPPRNSRSP